MEADASKLVDGDSKVTLADVKLPENVEFAEKDVDMTELVATVFDAEAEAAARDAEEAAAKAAEEASVTEAETETKAAAEESTESSEES